MTEMTLVKALNNALDLAMSKDPAIIIIGEDVGKDGGVFRVSEGLIEKYGERRVIDSPISEAGIVGAALGMSLNGMKPIVEMQFDGFIYPAWQEIVSHVSRMRTRSRGRFPCPMVIRFPYGGGINALEHHSEAMEAMFAHIPGMVTVIPSSPKEAKGLLLAAIKNADPVLFCEPKKIYRSLKEDVPDEYYEIPLGKAAVVQQGTDVTVISWGAMLHHALAAVKDMARKNISCEVIDLRTIMPWDQETVLASVKKTGRCVIVHEATKTAGFAGEIIATINEEILDSLQAPIARVTGYDIIMPLLKNEKHQLPSPERIAIAIEKTVHYQ